MTGPVIGAPTLAQRIGATARQVDYWTRRGWIPADNPIPGSGIQVTYSPAAVDHARAMVRLVAAGVAPGAAHVLAERLALADRIDLGDGITLSATRPPEDPQWTVADGAAPPSPGPSPNVESECPSTPNPTPTETSQPGPTTTE